MKAIETVYNGYRFRSRLEARWAVFFDTLGVKYDYEPEGFDLDGVRYLPDFWLPDQDCWFEVKGQKPTQQEEEKAWLLAYHTHEDVYVFWRGCQLPVKSERQYSHPRSYSGFPRTHYDSDELMFEKCSAAFYGPHEPPPFQDNTPYVKRPPEERAVIDEWRARVEFSTKDIPLSVARLAYSLRPYAFHVAVQAQSGAVQLEVDEGYEIAGLASISQEFNKHGELLEFLSIRPGWKCYFSEGCYLTEGWGECPRCNKVSLEYSSCHCTGQPPYTLMEYDTPRLIAAYTAARQARFEFGEQGTNWKTNNQPFVATEYTVGYGLCATPRKPYQLEERGICVASNWKKCGNCRQRIPPGDFYVWTWPPKGHGQKAHCTTCCPLRNVRITNSDYKDANPAKFGDWRKQPLQPSDKVRHAQFGAGVVLHAGEVFANVQFNASSKLVPLGELSREGQQA